MLWAFAAAGAMGVLIGLWFRVAALAAASGLTTAASVSAAVFTGADLVPSLVSTFTILGLLQTGYLVGVMLACAQSRGDAPTG